MKLYYVYIITNKYNNVLYIGVTENLARRIYEHKNKLINGFTKQYNCTKLVWYEETNDIDAAITREKQMKKWKREYKNNVIKEMNPNWIDLYESIM
jgi:putative endonuclease